MRTAPRLDAGWIERLAARLQTPPTRPRVPLRLVRGAGLEPVTIGTIEPSLGSRLAHAGLPLRESRDSSADVSHGWLVEPAGILHTDAALSMIARWLHANELSAPWRDELLAVTALCDARDAGGGEPVGAIERAAVRPLGIATFAVHLVVTNEQGCVWVQQRARDKSTDPGLWDTTMGGLASANESLAQTLQRETWEEAGLRLADLRNVRGFGRYTVRRPTPEGYMVEHIDMFEATAPSALTPVNQDGEVERFECLPEGALIERLHADAFTLEAAMILAAWLGRTD